MAIAFDASSAGTLDLSNTSISWSHTCTGSNGLLVVGLFESSGIPVVSSVTYNSVGLTEIDVQAVDTDRHFSLWYLLGPSTGTNTVTINASTPSTLYGAASSYTGVAQSGQPDSHGFNVPTGTAGSLAVSTTVVANGCWLVGVAKEDAGTTASYSIGAALNEANGMHFFDSNGTVGTGSITDTITWGTSVHSGAIIASFKPAGAAPRYLLVRN